ncbi:MAG: glycosyltransferase family 39 protein [Blastocatellia bacterium]|nr:glycosyltransferase family 39 protein [Blastocatellia bacterium]
MLNKSYSLNQTRIFIFVFSLIISLFSYLYFFHLGLTNLYGDGIAHLNIARKIVDLDTTSIWQRYIQLGSPWLPLPHFLMLPFIWHDYFWRTGLAGSLVSMISYLICVMSLFEIANIFASSYFRQEQHLLAGILAALIFALNPSILYLQSSPMTELPFLATYVLALYLLLKWSLSDSKKYLILSAFITSLATLTRYEAWAMLPGAVLVISIAQQGNIKERAKSVFLWAAIGSLGIIYWLWHNWAIYGNPLEFYNGFYSAKGIYLRLQSRLGWADFTVGNLPLASLVAIASSLACSGLVSLLGIFSFFYTIFLIFRAKNKEFLIKVLPTFLLVIPFLFTIYSLYTGNIQIYPLSAISLLNVRYGLNITLALAIFPIIFLKPDNTKKFLIVFSLVVFNYYWLISAGVNQLAVIQEPYRNNFNISESRARRKLTNYLLTHPPQKKTLIYSGDLAAVIAFSRLKFQDIVFEGIDGWHSEKIPENVNTVVVKEGDSLWQKLEKMPDFPKDFQLIYEIGPSPRMMVWQKIESDKINDK